MSELGGQRPQWKSFLCRSQKTQHKLVQIIGHCARVSFGPFKQTCHRRQSWGVGGSRAPRFWAGGGGGGVGVPRSKRFWGGGWGGSRGGCGGVVGIVDGS